MSVIREKRTIEIEDLVFTWDGDCKDGRDGEDAMCFSHEEGEAGELSVDAYDIDGNNVFSMTMSVEEEEALRELLNDRYADRHGY
jgi:uncharacterized protein (DUF2147 family)